MSAARAGSGGPWTRASRLAPWGLFGRKLCRAPNLMDDRMKRIVHVVGGTLVADREMPLVGEPFAQAGQDAQLADAGLAREQRDFAFAGACVPPSFDKQGAVMRLDRDASKRVSVSASRNTAHARIGASNPFRSFGSRDLSSKVSPRRRRV